MADKTDSIIHSMHRLHAAIIKKIECILDGESEPSEQEELEDYFSLPQLVSIHGKKVRDFYRAQKDASA